MTNISDDDDDDGKHGALNAIRRVRTRSITTSIAKGGPPELLRSVDILDFELGQSSAGHLGAAGGFQKFSEAVKTEFSRAIPLYGKSFFIWGSKSALRQRAVLITTSKQWKLLLRVVTWVSTVTLFLETRKIHGEARTSRQSIFIIFDWVVVAFFLSDLLLNCIAWGCIYSRRSEQRDDVNHTYLGGSSSNRIDAVVLFCSVAFMSVGLHGVHSLRMLKCLPHAYFPEMRSARAVFTAVERSSSLLIDNIAILLFFILFFSICSVEFFSGGHAFGCMSDSGRIQHVFCSTTSHSIFPEKTCSTTVFEPSVLSHNKSLVNCVNVGSTGPAWVTFDNFGFATITNFQIIQLENWGELIRPLFRSRDKAFTYMFFTLMIVVCRFIVINLFIAIIVFHFQELRVQMDGEDPDGLPQSGLTLMILDFSDWFPKAKPYLKQKFPSAFIETKEASVPSTPVECTGNSDDGSPCSQKSHNKSSVSKLSTTGTGDNPPPLPPLPHTSGPSVFKTALLNKLLSPQGDRPPASDNLSCESNSPRHGGDPTYLGVKKSKSFKVSDKKDSDISEEKVVALEIPEVNPLRNNDSTGTPEIEEIARKRSLAEIIRANYVAIGKYITVGVLIANVCIQATEHDGMSKNHQNIIDITEYGFLAFFTAELLIRAIHAFDHIRDLVLSKLWWFELSLVILSYIAQVDKDLVPATRLRIFRLMSYNEIVLTYSSKINIEPILSLFYMMMVTLLLFSCIGMQFFNGLLKIPEKNVSEWMPSAWVSRFHFDTIARGMQTLFIVMAGDNWSYPMYQMMSASDTEHLVPTMAFFYIFIICSNWILLSMFIAVLLQEFDIASPLDKSLENHDVVTQSRSLFSTFLRKVDMSNAADTVDEENIASVCAIVNMHKWASRARTEQDKRANRMRKVMLSSKNVADSARVLQGEGITNSIKGMMLTLKSSEMWIQKSGVKGANRLTGAQTTDGPFKQQTMFANLIRQAKQASEVVEANVDKEKENLAKLEQDKSRLTSATKMKIRMLTKVSGDPKRLRELALRESESLIVEANDVKDAEYDAFGEPVCGSDDEAQALHSPTASEASFPTTPMRKAIVNSHRNLLESAAIQEALSQMQKGDSTDHEQGINNEASEVREVGDGLSLPKWMDIRRSKRKRKLKAMSLFCLTENNKLRMIAVSICRSAIFNRGILAAVLASSFLLIFSAPSEAWKDSNMHPPRGGVLSDSIDGILAVVFLVIFTAEFIVKVVAYGFVWMSRSTEHTRRREQAYITDPWNVLDFVILIVMYASFILQHTNGSSSLKSVRIFRVLRVIRVIRRVESLKLISQALLHPQTLIRIGFVMILASFSYLSFGIVAMNMLSGKLGSCTDTLQTRKLTCTGTFSVSSNGHIAPRVWKSPERNFNTIGESIITLIGIASGEDWATPMLSAIDSTGVETGPIRDNKPVYAAFFIFYMILMSFFIVNLVIFVITDATRRQSGTAGMVREQVEWSDLMHSIKVTRPLQWIPPPGRNKLGELTVVGKLRLCLLRHVGPKHYLKGKYRYFDVAINTVILINILLMTTEYREGDMTSFHSSFVEHANTIIVCIYIIESLIRIIACSPGSYFGDRWNRFDSFIVGGSIFGLVISTTNASQHSGVAKKFFSVIRIFRILRVFKMVRRFKGVAFLFDSLLASIPSISNIILVVVLFMWIWGAIGVELFGGVKMSGSIHSDMNFRSFFNSFCTLTLVITSDDWIGIMQDARLTSPHCSTRPPSWINNSVGSTADLSKGFNDCGSPTLAAIYFISFFVLGAYVFLNLVTAAILDEVQHAISRDRFRVSEEEIEDFKLVWSHIVQGNSRDIPRWRMAHLMESLFFRNKLGLHPIYHKKFFYTYLLKLDWYKLKQLSKSKTRDVTCQRLNAEMANLWPPPVWDTYRFHEVLHILCHHAYEDVALNLEEVEQHRQFQRKADRLLATQVIQSVVRTICALHYLEKDKYPTLCLSPNQKVFLKDLREKIRRWKQQNEERMVRSGIVQRVRLYRLPGVLQKVGVVQEEIRIQTDQQCRKDFHRSSVISVHQRNSILQHAAQMAQLGSHSS